MFFHVEHEPISDPRRVKLRQWQKVGPSSLLSLALRSISCLISQPTLLSFSPHQERQENRQTAPAAPKPFVVPGATRASFLQGSNAMSFSAAHTTQQCAHTAQQKSRAAFREVQSQAPAQPWVGLTAIARLPSAPDSPQVPNSVTKSIAPPSAAGHGSVRRSFDQSTAWMADMLANLDVGASPDPAPAVASAAGAASTPKAATTTTASSSATRASSARRTPRARTVITSQLTAVEVLEVTQDEPTKVCSILTNEKVSLITMSNVLFLTPISTKKICRRQCRGD